MTTQRHTFAESLAQLEAELSDDRRDWYNNRHAALLDDMIACIKEQRAALDRLLHLIAPDDEARFFPGSEVDQARKTLAKWDLPP